MNFVVVFQRTMRQDGIYLVFGRTLKSVAAALAVVLVLVLGVCAVSPSLHKLVHPDSDHPDHYCVIAAFATGQLNWTAAILLIAIIGVFLNCGVFPAQTSSVSYLDFYFSPNRAPPR